jgi:hypothetical protein
LAAGSIEAGPKDLLTRFLYRSLVYLGRSLACKIEQPSQAD